jgi:hypothetical protein
MFLGACTEVPHLMDGKFNSAPSTQKNIFLGAKKFQKKERKKKGDV